MINKNYFPDLKEVGEDFLKNLDSSMIIEKKWDGTAALVQIINGDVKIMGRGIKKDGTRQDYTDKFPEIRNAVIGWNINDIEILGEIVVLDDEENESFNLIQPRLNREHHIDNFAMKYPATFIIFDIYSLEGRPLTSPYEGRIEILKSLQNIYIPKIIQPGYRFRNQTKQNILDKIENGNWEGVVIKDMNSRYGQNQYKYKPRITQDVFWEGEFIPGKNKNLGLVGSLTCYQYVNDVKICVGNISGLSDKDRKRFTDIQPTINKDNHLIFEVKTHEVLASGKFRYPNFIRERPDKSSSQCIQKTRIPIPNKSTLFDWL